MPTCRVKPCSATRSQTNLTLHQFPKDPDIRKQWLSFCHCQDGTNLYICSKHFRPSDYENILMTSARRKLRKEAVPTIRDPVESDRASRVAVRNRKKLVTDLLAMDAKRSREAESYRSMVAEAGFEPFSQTATASLCTTFEPSEESMAEMLFDPVFNSTTLEASETSTNRPPQTGSGWVQVKRGTVKKLTMQIASLRGTIHALRTELKEKDKIIRSLSRQSEQKTKDSEPKTLPVLLFQNIESGRKLIQKDFSLKTKPI